jgi:hypothetical protein
MVQAQMATLMEMPIEFMNMCVLSTQHPDSDHVAHENCCRLGDKKD